MTKQATQLRWDDVVESTQGVRPAIQARSLKKRHDLLLAGRELMRTRRLEDISIKEICTQAHCTVGSFYSRFEDKESYFDAMVAQACHDTLILAEEAFGGREWQERSGLEVADTIIEFIIGLFKGELFPVLTESFLRECRGQVFSTPLDEFGKSFGRTLSKALGRHVDTQLHPEPTQAIRFALQTLYSHLTNAALRRTIFSIASEEYKEQLKVLFRQYLGIR